MYNIKAAEVKPSITLELSAKAKKLKSDGKQIINLTVGEPNFNTPDYIVKGALEGIEKGFTKYTQTSGIIELKEEIVKKLKSFNNIKYNSSNILVSTGAKQCLFNAIFSIINDGDEVIIPSPYWVSYTEMVRLSGGKSVIVDTSKENEFKIDVKSLDEKLTNKTKILILNNPNNPTGSVYNESELKEIGNWAVKNNVIIIADEIYERLTYDTKHVSIASLSEEIKNNTITISGFSKTYSMTGWRLGYCAAHEDIIKIMNAVQSHTTACANSIAQYAGYVALRDESKYNGITNMIDEFNNRRKKAIDYISKNSNLTINSPKGAFYIFIDIESLIGKSFNGKILNSSIDISEVLLDEFNIAVVPGIGFGNDDYIRISYAADEELIIEGIKRIIELEKLAK
ncbi:pyridoxal phosphate-dependent aminotransferase [Mediannikoviicoccus vaginalis]|uniref:pyridoxal phosphate-dependent aminotransferase n=1 Tax=Mediannikoviicoccus vaginalis TaxID=2899727 RepID=UPI001F31429E|nr:pyridoxal phosphate-dependent aminotransferase [Mediannikoviicoccus vaginalis]